MIPLSKELSPNDLSRIVALIETNKQALLEKTLNLDITRFFSGHHRTVFEFREFPQHVIKIDQASESESILKAIQLGREVVNTLALSRIHIPHVTSIPFKENEIIWVEEKLEGIFNADEAKEKSEIAFESNPEKWIELFGQAAELIVKTGYSDVDWRNLLFMGEGIGFVDFERVSTSISEKAFGLLRLMQIAPDYCIERIVAVVKENNLTHELFSYASQSDIAYSKLHRFEDALKYFQEKRHAALERNKKLRLFHKKVLVGDAPVAADQYAEGTVEWRIINRFNNDLLKDPYHLKHKQGSKEALRTMHWQPFLFSVDKGTIAAFDQALDRLQKDGIIFDVSKRPALQESCINYDIQF